MTSIASKGSSISKQDYGTPPELIRAIENFFQRKIVFDLAADSINAKASRFFVEKDDSLQQQWAAIKCHPGQVLFLNPPFKTLRPWVEKCAEEKEIGATIITLTLASIGATWFREIVAPNAAVYILNSRVTFVGQPQGYTKDLMVCLWAPGVKGFNYWDWEKWV